MIGILLDGVLPKVISLFLALLLLVSGHMLSAPGLPLTGVLSTQWVWHVDFLCYKYLYVRWLADAGGSLVPVADNVMPEASLLGLLKIVVSATGVPWSWHHQLLERQNHQHQLNHLIPLTNCFSLRKMSTYSDIEWYLLPYTEQGSLTNELRQVAVPYISSTTCRGPEYYGGQLTSNMVCAGYRQGLKDTCQASYLPLHIPLENDQSEMGCSNRFVTFDYIFTLKCCQPCFNVRLVSDYQLNYNDSN